LPENKQLFDFSGASNKHGNLAVDAPEALRKLKAKVRSTNFKH
jgi:hypothetical protein